MKKTNELDIKGTIVRVVKIGEEDYICLTDMLKAKDGEFFITDWLRNRNTLEYIGIWEQVYNPAFNYGEFATIRNQAGLNSFKIGVQEFAERTNAVSLISKAGRYGGTYAHKDIAFEFAMWISAEFKIYIVKEFQRLKAKEQELIGWSAKRELAKINYRIHTDAIKENLIPAQVSRAQMNIIYASEMRPRRRRRVARRATRGALRSKVARGRADVLNVALFGKTHQQWQAANPDLKGNQRDYATINQLICISNMENINAVMINENAPQKRLAFRRAAAQRAWRASARAQRSGRKEPRVPQPQRLKKLNEIAIQQMRILSEVEGRKYLK